MDIQKNLDGTKLTIKLIGRLDTQTAPNLEKEFADGLKNVTELIFDLSSLEYISSAGLRVLLMAQNEMDEKGSMKIRGAGELVMEVFDITGFSDVLDIE